MNNFSHKIIMLTRDDTIYVKKMDFINAFQRDLLQFWLNAANYSRLLNNWNEKCVKGALRFVSILELALRIKEFNKWIFAETEDRKYQRISCMHIKLFKLSTNFNVSRCNKSFTSKHLFWNSYIRQYSTSKHYFYHDVWYGKI